MEILEDNRRSTAWITFVADGRWCQAKVFDEPSTFGINDGRVSKLVIGKGPTRDPNRDFFDQMAYNFDRGLDFDDLPDGVLDKIVSELESLPKVHTD